MKFRLEFFKAHSVIIFSNFAFTYRFVLLIQKIFFSNTKISDALLQINYVHSWLNDYVNIKVIRKQAASMHLSKNRLLKPVIA